MAADNNCHTHEVPLFLQRGPDWVLPILLECGRLVDWRVWQCFGLPPEVVNRYVQVVLPEFLAVSCDERVWDRRH